MKIINTLIIILLSSHSLFSQGSAKTLPIVGEECPNFLLSDLAYYETKSASLADFKGKWLVLDFWNRYCTVCLNSMPKMNKLQNRFRDNAKVILVGYTGSQYYKSAKEPDDKFIRKLYEMNRVDHDLKLTVAYDSILFKKFDVGACPYIVIINPAGMVKGITSRVSEVQLDSLMKNQKVHLRRAYNSTERKELLKIKAQQKKDSH